MTRWALPFLAAWLLALPTAAQAPVNAVTLCEDDCTHNNGTELSACTQACPVPSNPREFRFVQCMSKCSVKFNAKQDSCKARCNGKPDPHAQKKSKSQPIRKHTDDE